VFFFLGGEGCRNGMEFFKNKLAFKITFKLLLSGKSEMKNHHISDYFYKKLPSAIPVQPWTGPEGSRRFRLPDLSALRIGRIYSPINIPGTHSS